MNKKNYFFHLRAAQHLSFKADEILHARGGPFRMT